MYIGRNTDLGTWGPSQREFGEAINHRVVPLVEL